MQYRYLEYERLLNLCREVFASYGFSQEESADITDVLLAADLRGIESHGIQRLVRYDYEITSGLVDVHAIPETVCVTPISAVIDAKCGMGQLTAQRAMKLAISKAKQVGCGMVTVRNSNHFGIAGYYSDMAAEEDLIGVCMTNTEAIMVPTYGKDPMLGTNPIALAMPADPYPFSLDCATTAVPRGKLEVYAKRGVDVPLGWGVDEEGRDSANAAGILGNIIAKAGGGILPVGGSSEQTGSHKGYGFGMICELFTGILSGGLTSDRVNRGIGKGTGICHCFMAVDYGIFGDKAVIKKELSDYLARIRVSAKADGKDRIYTHGEKEAEMCVLRKREGIPVNDKTFEEIRRISMARLGLSAL